jgi:hypothetical protein
MTETTQPSSDGGALRILSVAPTSFFNDYGCHVRILEEARALQALGHDVTILTYFKGNDVPGFRIIRTTPTPWRANYEVGSSRHKYAFDVLLAIRLVRVLARNRFDVIHAHLHEGALIASLLAWPWRVPVFMDYQGSMTDEMAQHGFLKPGHALATAPLACHRESLAERLPTAIFTSTQNAADGLRAHCHGQDHPPDRRRGCLVRAARQADPGGARGSARTLRSATRRRRRGFSGTPGTPSGDRTHHRSSGASA